MTPARFWRRTLSVSCVVLLSAAWPVEKTAAAENEAVVELAHARDLETLRTRLAAGADVNATQPDGATALHWAAHWDDVVMADALLRAGARVDAANDLGVTPLMLACTNRSTTMVTKLLSARASVKMARPTGETALMTCARTGADAAVAALLTAGADPNAATTDQHQTALMWAAAEGHLDVVDRLVKARAHVNARTAGGFTPLLFAARQGRPAIVERLAAAGAEVNVRMPDGTTPLLLAAMSMDAITVQDYRIVPAASGHEEAALVLLRRGANPALTDARGMTPLHASVEMPKPRLLQALIDRHVDLNARLTGGLPFRRADIISRNYYGGATAFWLAAKNGDVPSMKALAAAGANPEIPNSGGITPILVAAGLGQTDSRLPDEALLLAAIRYCLDELGCDLHAVAGGRNAAHGAASVSANRIVRFVAEYGVDLNARDRRNQTPLDVTRDSMRPRPETGALLTSLGAR